MLDVTEVIQFGKIYAEDLARGRGTQSVTLADGTSAVLHEIDVDATGRPSGMTWGYATVADGGTVAHGMGVTPGAVIVTCSVAGEFASVTAKDATTFTVVLRSHYKTDQYSPNGTTQTIYWVAFVERE